MKTHSVTSWVQIATTFRLFFSTIIATIRKFNFCKLGASCICLLTLVSTLNKMAAITNECWHDLPIKLLIKCRLFVTSSNVTSLNGHRDISMLTSPYNYWQNVDRCDVIRCYVTWYDVMMPVPTPEMVDLVNAKYH